MNSNFCSHPRNMPDMTRLNSLLEEKRWEFKKRILQSPLDLEGQQMVVLELRSSRKVHIGFIIAQF